jgi:hypothetical protein
MIMATTLLVATKKKNSECALPKLFNIRLSPSKKPALSNRERF